MDCHGLSGRRRRAASDGKRHGRAGRSNRLLALDLHDCDEQAAHRDVQVLAIGEKANVHSAVGRIMVCRRPILTPTTNFIAIALVGLPEVAIARRTMAARLVPVRLRMTSKSL